MPDQTRTPQLPDPSPTGPAPAPTTRPAPSIAPVAPTLGAAPAAGEVPADLLAMMKADAAQRSGVAVDSITVQQARALEWSDSSLGCPQPGVAYMQVITPGYQVVLQAGADMYDYHADERGRFVLCEK